MTATNSGKVSLSIGPGQPMILKHNKSMSKSNHLYLWNSIEGQNVGQISLRLSNGTYINYRPVKNPQSTKNPPSPMSASDPNGEPDNSLEIPGLILDDTRVTEWWSKFEFLKLDDDHNSAHVISEAIREGISPKFKEQFQYHPDQLPDQLFFFVKQLVWVYHSYSRNVPCAESPAILSLPVKTPTQLCDQFVTTFMLQVETGILYKKVSLLKLLTDFCLSQINSNFKPDSLRHLFHARSQDFLKQEKDKIQALLKEAQINAEHLWTFLILHEVYNHFKIYEYTYNQLSIEGARALEHMATILAKLFVAHKTICYNICSCILQAREMGMPEVDQKFVIAQDSVSLLDLHLNATPTIVQSDKTLKLIGTQELTKNPNLRRPFWSEQFSETFSTVQKNDDLQIELLEPRSCAKTEETVQSLYNSYQIKAVRASIATGSESKFVPIPFECIKKLCTIHKNLLTSAKTWTHEKFLQEIPPPHGAHMLYFWKPHSIEKDAGWLFKVGHISLCLTNGTYVSHWPGVNDEDGANVLKGIPSGPVYQLEDDIKYEGGPPDASIQIPRELLASWRVTSWWETTLNDPTHKYSLLHKNCAHAVCEAILVGLTVFKWKEKFQLTTAKRPRSVYNAMREIVWLYHAALSSGAPEPRPPLSTEKALTPPEELQFVTAFVQKVMTRVGKSRIFASGPIFTAHDLRQSFLISIHSLKFINSDFWRLDVDVDLTDFNLNLNQFINQRFKQERLNSNETLQLFLIQLAHNHFQIYREILIKLTITNSTNNPLIKVAQSLAKIFVRYARIERINCNNICEAIVWAKGEKMSEVSDLYEIQESDTQSTKISLHDLHANCVALFAHKEATSQCTLEAHEWTAKDFMTEEMSKTEIVKGYFIPRPAQSQVGQEKVTYKYFRRPFTSEWSAMKGWLERGHKDNDTGEKFQPYEDVDGTVKESREFVGDSGWETISDIYKIISKPENSDCEGPSCENCHRVVRQFLSVQKEMNEFVVMWMQNKISFNYN